MFAKHDPSIGHKGYPTTYEQARCLLGTRDRFKLGNNTTLEARPRGAFAVRLHYTDVVTFHADGRVTLDSGGWQTPTTRDRFRACGFRVYTAGGVARIGDVAFRDGLTLWPNGNVTGHAGPALAAERARRRAQRRGEAEPWDNRNGTRADGGNPADVLAGVEWSEARHWYEGTRGGEPAARDLRRAARFLGANQYGARYQFPDGSILALGRGFIEYRNAGGLPVPGGRRAL